MPDKKPSILLGALVSVVISLGLAFVIANGGMMAMTIGGCAACVVAFVGPMVAVWHYVSTNDLTVLPGTGAGIGAATGVVGAVLGGAMSITLRAIGLLPTAAETQERLRDLYIEQGVDPAQIDQQTASMEWMSGPVAEIGLGIVIGLIVGAIGGAVAASVFKRGPQGDTLDPL